MQYIYARVSKDDQTTDNQVQALLKDYPGAQVIQETMSGWKDRPELNKLTEQLKEGDELIVAALDRLGRKTSEVLARIEDLERRKIILKSKREGVDYSTPCGRLIIQVLCSVAEMERNLISERTKAALAVRKANGQKLGAPRKYGPEIAKKVKALKEQGNSFDQIAEKTGVSRSTAYLLLKAA